MATKPTEYNFDEIEALVASVPGVRPGAVTAFAGDASIRGSSISVVAEIAGIRAGETEETAVAIRRMVQERMNLPLERIHLVRPGWLRKCASKAHDRAETAEKIATVLQRRRQERLIRVGDHQENLDEEWLDLWGGFGANSRVRTPTEIFGPSNIHVGSWVSLGRYGKIIILDDFSGGVDLITQHHPDISFNPRATPFSVRFPTIVLKDGVSLGDFFFIAATCRIEIGQHVITSQRLFLTDCSHVFDDPRLPVQLQGNTEGTPLIIEDGCWLGVNVSIIKGVRVGRHSVIGSHSVVNRDVPAFAVVGGVPAKIIRTQDPSLAPLSQQGFSLNREAVIQALRSITEACLGHVLSPDLDLRNDGLLTHDVINSLLTQVPAAFPVSAKSMQTFLDSSRTLRDLGHQVYNCVQDGGV